MNSYEDLSLVKGMIICSGISSTHHQLTTVRLSMSRTAFLNILREWEAICMCARVCVSKIWQQHTTTVRSMSVYVSMSNTNGAARVHPFKKMLKGRERPWKAARMCRDTIRRIPTTVLSSLSIKLIANSRLRLRLLLEELLPWAIRANWAGLSPSEQQI